MALLPFASSFTAKCVYYYKADSWAPVAPAYYCYLEGISVKTPDTAITGIEGDHHSGKSDSDVNGLWISSPDALYFPKGIEKFFNIKAITFSDSGLNSLSQDDLRVFPDLTAIWFRKNKLTTIESGLFAFNPKLKLVDFQENQIVSVSPDIFDPIESLESSSFAYNICTQKYGSTPQEIEDMKKEFAEKCQSGQVAADCKTATWNNFGSTYYCEFENMKVVNSVTFASQFRGTHLPGKTSNDVNAIWIKNSPELSFFPKRFEKIFLNIKGLSITDTGLTTITYDDLQAFPELTALWVFSNKLTTIEPKLFANNPKMTIIDFGNNQISKIAGDLLDYFDNLEIAKFNKNVCTQTDATSSGSLKAFRSEIVEKC